MAFSGLRARSLLALLLTCLLVLLPAAVLGWLVLQSIHQHFAEGYVTNLNQLSRERIFAPISREQALSNRLAHSEVTRQWLLAEDDESKRQMFFREAEGFRQDFRDRAYFITNVASQHYYFNSDEAGLDTRPRYRLSADNPDDSWFFSTRESTTDFNINVDRNPMLNTTRLWFNILIRDRDELIGIAGSGVDLSNFISDFIANDMAGVSPMIIDRQGAIQAHQDASLIALNSGADGSADPSSQIFSLLDNPQDDAALRQAMLQAEQLADSTQLLRLNLQGRDHLVALGFIPALGWHLVTAVDLTTAEIIDARWLWPLIGLIVGLALALLLLFSLGTERLLLRPLRQLRQSAQALSDGNYSVQLPVARDDELGELSRSFGVMAERIRENARELENRVQVRTEELQQANRTMAEAQRKIADSISYASLIQRTILPTREMYNCLHDNCAVLWRPRDVVGGDFYLFYDLGDRYLIGVADCAGHGVPGALMTMLGHAALDQAVRDGDPCNPAGILQQADLILRHMLGESAATRSVATSMDAGLVLVDRQRGQVTFAGARIDLYVSDGQQVTRLTGGLRALADKRRGKYQNITTELAGRSFYLCTDGFLDQAGGEQGFGFGNSRFEQMLLSHAHLPLSEQLAAFNRTLAQHQGQHPQRDDITMLCFRDNHCATGASSDA